MTKPTSKEMKKLERQADKYIEHKMIEILTDMEENFACVTHPYMFQNFAQLFISNFIRNYMHHNDLDIENIEDRALMLTMALVNTHKAAQIAFELCDDCMNDTPHAH